MLIYADVLKAITCFYLYRKTLLLYHPYDGSIWVIYIASQLQHLSDQATAGTVMGTVQTETSVWVTVDSPRNEGRMGKKKEIRHHF